MSKDSKDPFCKNNEPRATWFSMIGVNNNNRSVKSFLFAYSTIRNQINQGKLKTLNGFKLVSIE